MSLYGLIVFLETPQSRRKGRRRYVFISFVITGLSTFSYSLDAAWIFKCLFDATSPLGVLENIVKYEHLWGRTASLACLTTVIFIGDALLVSPGSQAKATLESTLIVFASGLPLLRDMEAQVVPHRHPSHDLPCLSR